MASLFAVGLPFTYDGTTNHFATLSGGAASVAAVTSADTLTIDGSSGTGALTVGANFTASAITVNNASDTLKSDGTHAFNCNGAVTLTTGTIDTAGAAMTWFNLACSGSSTRTLTITNSAITVNGSASSVSWDCATATGLTVNASGSTITLSQGGVGLTFRHGNLANVAATYNTVSFTGSGSPVITLGASATINNLSRIGTAVATDNLQLNSTITVNTSCTFTGNSQSNFLTLKSSVNNITRSLVCNGPVTCTNLHVQDISASGSGSPFYANTLGCEDLGNNSSWIFGSFVFNNYQSVKVPDNGNGVMSVSERIR